MTTPGVHVSPDHGHAAEVFTDAAIDFVAGLHRSFNGRRLELLAARAERQARIEQGERPDFLPETAAIREDDSWRVGPAPPDLDDRRVEITGPAEPKMMINALNSGAKVFMADFEDALSPTWENVVTGQWAVREAVRRRLTLRTDEKTYELKPEIATLVLRPRGWHLEEAHLLVDGEPISASLFDFGMAFFHNAREQMERGSGPYFYLPKLESHLEARLWNEVFVAAQDRLGLPHGSVRATVLIETILAALEMDEILWELRDHAAGLNAGRWDYIFSVIKKFRDRPHFVLPDRAAVHPAGQQGPWVFQIAMAAADARRYGHRNGSDAQSNRVAETIAMAVRIRQRISQHRVRNAVPWRIGWSSGRARRVERRCALEVSNGRRR